MRVWKAYGTPEGVERYCREHFPQAVLPHLQAVPGFLGAQVLVRPLEAETEVVVATTWASLEAVRTFAGEDYTAAVVEPAVRDLLARFDARVRHFSVHTYAPASGHSAAVSSQQSAASPSGDVSTASSVPPPGQ